MPFGVMCGYIVASIFGDAAAHETDCAGLLCWRWPLLIEIMLLSPLYLCLYFVHKESLQISLLAPTKSASHRSQTGTLQLSEKTGNSAESSVSLSLTAVPQSSKSGWQRPQSTSQDSYPRPLSLEHPAAHGSPLRMGHQVSDADVYGGNMNSNLDHEPLSRLDAGRGRTWPATRPYHSGAAPPVPRPAPRGHQRVAGRTAVHQIRAEEVLRQHSEIR